MILSKQQDNRQGFTLIELMVVIAIIAVLATVGIVTYSNARNKSSDARRKQDLQAIQVALESYYNVNQKYPIGTTTCTKVSDNCYFNSAPPSDPTDWLPSGLKSYFNGQKEPIDPINKMNADPAKIRAYAYTSSTFTGCPSSGHWYVLITLLDNSSDPQSVANTPTKWCNGSLIGPTQPSTYYIPGNAYVIVVKDK